MLYVAPFLPSKSPHREVTTFLARPRGQWLDSRSMRIAACPGPPAAAQAFARTLYFCWLRRFVHELQPMPRQCHRHVAKTGDSASAGAAIDQGQSRSRSRQNRWVLLSILPRKAVVEASQSISQPGPPCANQLGIRASLPLKRLIASLQRFAKPAHLRTIRSVAFGSTHVPL